jgi:sigma-B regulation protein RsbU (phosphoserine phosphatase)
MTPPGIAAPSPPPPSRGRGKTVFIVWLATLGVTIFCDRIRPVLERAHLTTGWASFIGFLSAMLLVALTLYGMALAARWLLRHLFWRVGRRLFLSYVMIGIFPFFLFAILLMAIVYMIGGVMSHAALRGERQASLGQLEAAAQEYSLRGEKPPDALPTLEIYDSADNSADKLPAWLRRKTFSGLVARNKESLLVAARQVADEDGGPSRTVVFVQPIDRAWVDALYEKDGMIVRMGHEDQRRDVEEAKPRDGSLHVTVGGQDGAPVKMKRGGTNLNFDDGDIGERVVRALWPPFRNIVWADVASLTDWNTGNEGDGRQLATLIINPSRNLFHFYFGASSDRYLSVLVQVILGLTITLLCVYFLAALFAGMLIFSITRAVNRIEKGTKAVERGDFSYRIGMKPNNQLGEMARSFDRMTESIASLLVNVAENERLQSEIAIAATIQRNLLPKEGPRFRGVSFSAHFEPTASIGGDYYDVFNIDKSRLAVAIGDVSGHGLSTGLVMAMVKAAITTLVEEGADEVSLFHRLNDLVFRSTERRAFMTLAFTIFDLEKGTIRHTNAGHLYPYLLRNGQPPVAIEVPSLPLGVRADVTTRTAEMQLQEGDAIVYLSDGIVEAQDPNGEPFGFEQLEGLLDAGNDRSPNGIRDAILEAVARHSATRAADDDRTVMVIRFDSLRSVMKPLQEGVEEEALVPASA